MYADTGSRGVHGVWDPIPFAGNPDEPNLSFAFSSNAVAHHHHVSPRAKLCSIVNAELVSTHDPDLGLLLPRPGLHGSACRFWDALSHRTGFRMDCHRLRTLP